MKGKTNDDGENSKITESSKKKGSKEQLINVIKDKSEKIKKAQAAAKAKSTGSNFAVYVYFKPEDLEAASSLGKINFFVATDSVAAFKQFKTALTEIFPPTLDKNVELESILQGMRNNQSFGNNPQEARKIYETIQREKIPLDKLLDDTLENDNSSSNSSGSPTLGRR